MHELLQWRWGGLACQAALLGEGRQWQREGAGGEGGGQEALRRLPAALRRPEPGLKAAASQRPALFRPLTAVFHRVLEDRL